MSNKEQRIDITRGRKITECVLHPLLNYKIEDGYGGMARADNLLSSGYGLILGFNHFSKRDAPIYGEFSLQYAKNHPVPLVLPIAYHQYEDYKRILEALAKVTYGQLYPIVIDDTVEIPHYEHLSLNQGMERYIPAAVDALQQGGIVALSLQGGRKSSLGEPVPALSTLMVKLFQHGVKDYAVQCIGISPKKDVEQDAWDALAGWNLTMPYVVKVGQTFTYPEITQTLDLRRPRDFRKVDEWGYNNLRYLVQPSYLEQPDLLRRV